MILFFALLVNSAPAQDMSFLGPSEPDKVTLAAESQFLSAPDDAPAVEEQKASFGIPLYHIEKKGLSFIGKGQRIKLSRPMAFPENKVAIPDEFGSADFGFGWAEADAEGNRFSASGTYGNAGTQLFAGENKAIVNANLVWHRNKTDHSWFYFVSYANNRAVLNNIPLVGLAYAKMTKEYTAVIGLPFGYLNWRPGNFNYTLVASPFSVATDLGYRFWGPLSAYAGVGWAPRAFNIVKDSEERLIIEEKFAVAGVRANFDKRGSLSLAYIYAFDRGFKYGKSLNDKNVETVEVGDASGVQAKWRFTF